MTDLYKIMGFHRPESSHFSRNTTPNEDDSHLCKAILYDEIRDTSIRIWDAMIFVPNAIFLAYLLYRFRQSRDRVRALNTFPILRNFYIFIYLCVTVSMARCFVSVAMKVHTTGGDITDKIFWVIVRFFLLSTEISVLVFGLFSGHLDVRQSIRRILSITLLVSLVYSICQGSFEIIAPDASFYIASRDYHLYAHGGMLFWFATCAASFAIYLTVVLLPWTPCRNRLLLPTKRSFYMYATILAALNLIQALGALSFSFDLIEGLCVVDATTYLYFTLFTPLVYFTFLSPFLAAGSCASAAAALVTTTAGAERIDRSSGGASFCGSTFQSTSMISGGNNSGSSANTSRQQQQQQQSAPPPPPPLYRPTQLFSSGLRGAVNFSYRPQIDDEQDDDDDRDHDFDHELLDDCEDDFAAIGAGRSGRNNPSSRDRNRTTSGLHFEHFGPYAYNQPRQGYLVYGQQQPQQQQQNIRMYGSNSMMMPRSISSFSFQSNSNISNQATTPLTTLDSCVAQTEAAAKTTAAAGAIEPVNSQSKSTSLINSTTTTTTTTSISTTTTTTNSNSAAAAANYRQDDMKKSGGTDLVYIPTRSSNTATPEMDHHHHESTNLTTNITTQFH